MSRGRAALLTVAMIAVPLAASAQMRPWPTEAPPQQQGTAAWPGEGGTAGAPPAAPMTAPMGAPPGMMGGGVQGPPQGGFGGPPVGGAQASCANEFTRLRTETEKHGALAKAASDRKVSREEMCKLITNLVAAESKWLQYARKNVQTCAIPQQLIGQMTAGHTHLTGIRKNICSTEPTARAAAPPSLSEALGTPLVPADRTSQAPTKRGGVLDTLSGPLTR